LVSEEYIVNSINCAWTLEDKIVVKELVISLEGKNIKHKYLEGRKRIRIDLACYDPLTNKIIFVEAENGIWLQHPQIYLPFCDFLYVASPYDDSATREEQLDWAKKEGIGVIEVLYDGYIMETLPAIRHRIHPAIREDVLNRIITKSKKARKLH